MLKKKFISIIIALLTMILSTVLTGSNVYSLSDEATNHVIEYSEIVVQDNAVILRLEPQQLTDQQNDSYSRNQIEQLFVSQSYYLIPSEDFSAEELYNKISSSSRRSENNGRSCIYQHEYDPSISLEGYSYVYFSKYTTSYYVDMYKFERIIGGYRNVSDNIVCTSMDIVYGSIGFDINHYLRNYITHEYNITGSSIDRSALSTWNYIQRDAIFSYLGGRITFHLQSPGGSTWNFEFRNDLFCNTGL